MGEAWKSGDWVDARRVRLVCILLLLLATILPYGFLLLTAHGTIDAWGRPIGTDFSDVYAAGWMADHGRAAAAWVWPEHYKVQQALHHSQAVPFYGWHYPPPFLLLASVLATLPYLVALTIWLGTTLAGAVMVARRIVPGPGTTLAVLAAPASFVCIGHGQNAFLTASLLAGGLALLDRRPWAAGLLLGCLVYKPQFAALLPVVLIAAGNRRAFPGAAISSLGLVALTLAVWGWPVWQAFHDSLDLTRARVIETGETGWEKIVTSFATARALGAPIPLAYGFQAVSTAFAIIGAAIAARWAKPALRGAAVCCAALLSTPYAMDYDLVILGGALCFLVADARERGWLEHEKGILAIAYLTPLFGRQIASLTLVPVDWIALVAVFTITLRRAWAFDLRERLPRNRPVHI
ncbi:DUF2029 domain-containing protein [Sphingomonas sp. CGMCC 1.13654]|uniref:DUF2029 domain-containing protein n=1 Tax=Sphingomonas chungangi TaxID=2683589 RepID=A0A838L524_9SPHN|nr:glycosyltransferase family 87 protein [Sphingomonas chungangi]MBA2933296.1 DUF2029 domain-containing protein [Sphingomonas chungangi]MVW57966.1 DUF2029 domain-containing protein [Sphingomonas chungangi]